MPSRRYRTAQDATDGEMATETVPRRRASRTVPRVPIAPEQRDQIITMLTDNPDVTVTEVAIAAGVSRATVRNVREQMHEGQDETTEQYGRSLAQRLPLRERVGLWAKLARGSVDPRLAFAQKAALQRVEELIGHVTAKEKRDAEANNSAPGPIFIFAQQSVPSAAPVLTSTPQLEPDNVQPASVTKDKRDGSAT